MLDLPATLVQAVRTPEPLRPTHGVANAMRVDSTHRSQRSHGIRPQLWLVCFSLHALACVDHASIDNDRGSSHTAPIMSADTDAGEDVVPPSDAAAPPESIAGSTIAAGCAADTPRSGEMCGGYYCGVSEATLRAAIDPASTCGGSITYACDGAIVRIIGACTRSAKSQMPTAPEPELRTAILECANQDEDVQQIAPDCISCFVDVAVCASNECLAACLAGDSPGCDACQREKKCQQPVFACSGLPNPL